MSATLWYPSVQDVLEIHEDIVSEYDDTSPGIQNRGDVEFALQFIRDGSFERLTAYAGYYRVWQ